MTDTPANPETDNIDSLCAELREDVIGGRALLAGPFGDRMITYADFTASARALHRIEDYIRKTVLVEYGNTHTEDSVTGLRTTARSLEAARMVKRSVGANDDDAVLWCGTGSTGAVMSPTVGARLLTVTVQVSVPTPPCPSSTVTVTV